ncbi:Uncharacterised protein [Mycobacteroides abscessus subsp. abscessus]|nr:Uncharacterised protein [Mycobacteroides abscessus subsp. abscessus]SKE98093.1 Uncharacterised protein [Mycobacteroides abscessus subsp. abscessus]
MHSRSTRKGTNESVAQWSGVMTEGWRCVALISRTVMSLPFSQRVPVQLSWPLGVSAMLPELR